jgi:hypothetical protein
MALSHDWVRPHGARGAQPSQAGCSPDRVVSERQLYWGWRRTQRWSIRSTFGQEFAGATPGAGAGPAACRYPPALPRPRRASPGPASAPGSRPRLGRCSRGYPRTGWGDRPAGPEACSHRPAPGRGPQVAIALGAGRHARRQWVSSPVRGAEVRAGAELHRPAAGGQGQRLGQGVVHSRCRASRAAPGAPRAGMRRVLTRPLTGALAKTRMRVGMAMPGLMACRSDVRHHQKRPTGADHHQVAVAAPGLLPAGVEIPGPFSTGMG